jgi:D-alanyl-D-alanine carboxypeptidase/D-alanyl-D-alanine-endopeptidase (penicillin-binding protein 4)
LKKIFSISNIFLIISIAALTSISYPQQKKSKLEKEISKIISTDLFKSSQITIDVYNLTTQKSILRKNEELLLHPASTIKILTTAASLLFLDNFSYKTSLYYKGNLRDSILTGDLFLVGGLDPEFSLRDLDSLISEIKKCGIKEIRGNIIADVSALDSLFWGNGWMWDDDPEPSSPYMSALNINYNCVSVNYTPGFVGNPALISLIPQSNYFNVINNSRTTENKTTPLRISRDWIIRSNNITVTGEISVNEKSNYTLLNVFNPANFFLTLFKENLIRNGISFEGKLKISSLETDAKEIFSFYREIDSVLINVNKNSNNLGSEMLLRAMALKYFGKPASAKNGIKLIDSLITIVGMDPKQYKIADGSGLSFYNLISAELLTEVLKFIYQNNKRFFTKLFSSLPVSGVDGTLKDRMKNSPAFQKVNAKTGTISGVSNLSGYLTNKSNHLIAFTIMIQNFTCPQKNVREIQDKICEIIYNN